LNPAGHTRLPRYVRGKSGVIARDWGVFVFPDTNAHHAGTRPQHCYSVSFDARELWDKSANSRERVYIDLWEDYLEPVASKSRPNSKRKIGRHTRGH
jgi:nitrile hydratase